MLKKKKKNKNISPMKTTIWFTPDFLSLMCTLFTIYHSPRFNSSKISYYFFRECPILGNVFCSEKQVSGKCYIIGNIIFVDNILESPISTFITVCKSDTCPILVKDSDGIFTKAFYRIINKYSDEIFRKDSNGIPFKDSNRSP